MIRRNLDSPPTPPAPFTSEQSTLPSTATTILPPSPPAETDISPSIMISVLILAVSVIIAASLYLLLRFLRRHRHRHLSPPLSSPQHHHQNSRRVSPIEKNPLIESLPLFTFDSLTSSGAGDCAVCLSKFEAKDLLRLLPICCHAFHAECIDTWLAANQTCPLCRSPIFLTDTELLRRTNSRSLSSSGSFRVEIGNVSQRVPDSSGEIRRSYSIGGSFDYILGDAVLEVPFGSFRRASSDFKLEIPETMAAPPEALAAEVGTRGGWLKDYLSHSLSSSRTTSFRGSGRWFFTGSSRRSTVPDHQFAETRDSDMDLEASRFGDEIGELFRWLSGV